MSDIYTNSHGKEFRFNELVCVEMLMGVPDEKRTGRLVQVRKGVGAFGSDIYLLRLRDGGLAAFENALMRRADDVGFENSFYRSNGKNPPVIPRQPTHEDDAMDVEYGIAGKWPETGFIVCNPSQPCSEKQSFSMMIVSK